MYDRKVTDARYRNKNKEDYNARVRAWKKAHPDVMREQRKCYRENNKDKISAYNALYREEKEEKRKEYNAQYYLAHSEDYKERLNEWRKSNPNKVAIQAHTRRAKRTEAGGSYTEQEWLDLCSMYGQACLCCGEITKLTPDHVVPIAKGGSSNIDNIQPLCQPCNSKKSTATTDYRNTLKGDSDICT